MPVLATVITWNDIPTTGSRLATREAQDRVTLCIFGLQEIRQLVPASATGSRSTVSV